MEKPSRMPKTLTAYLVCLVSAALLLLVCTKSSPLYPLNDWEDANIIFTVGRGLINGRVPFRDLYDQKGPLSYLLYGVAALISARSFTGLYIVETLCFSGFLYFSYRTLCLYEEKYALWAMPLLGALVASAMSFTHGGSVEELCLPALAFSLYDLLRYYRRAYPAPMPLWRLLVHGLLAGCVLWVKYTILGFYIAWMAVLFVALLLSRRPARAFGSCAVFLSGMALAALPWLAYFGVSGALPDMFRYYFLYNIFGYSGEAARGPLAILLNMGKNTLATFSRNPQYTLLIALGVLWLTLDKRAAAKKIEKWALWALCVLSCMGIYAGELGYRYYGLVLAVFACLGLAPLLKLFNRYVSPRLTGKKLAALLPAALAAVSLALCPLLSDNAYMLGWRRDALPQYRFAALMEETRREETTSLLCYQMMDAGFYLTARSEPDFRCFTYLNIAHEEIRAEQDGLLDSGHTEFVVTRGEPLSHENYELVGNARYFYEEAEHDYYLYQRIY